MIVSGDADKSGVRNTKSQTDGPRRGDRQQRVSSGLEYPGEGRGTPTEDSSNQVPRRSCRRDMGPQPGHALSTGARGRTPTGAPSPVKAATEMAANVSPATCQVASR